MEMTYGGALVMPSSYAMMDEDEMMYLEGGAWSIKRLWSNIVGLAGQYSVVKSLAKTAKVNNISVWTYAVMAVNWAKDYALNVLGAFCAKLGLQVAVVNRLIGLAVGCSAYAVGMYLGNNRVFY